MILPTFPILQQVRAKQLGLIPIGGIIGFPTNSPPSGWELWLPSTDRALRGVGPSTTAGATGGAANVTITGTTNNAGSHNGSTFLVYGTPFASAQSPPDAGYAIAATATVDDGVHAHTINSTLAYTPQYVRLPLIKKVDADGPIPDTGYVFGANAESHSRLDYVATYVGRVLQIASAIVSTGGTALPFSGNVTTSTAGSHTHGTETQRQSAGPGFSGMTYLPEPAGDHSHTVNVQVTAVNFKRCTAAMYQADGDTGVPVGTIIAYEGDDSYSPDWKPCDGSNGTVDIRDALLMLSDEAGAGVTSGDGSVTWTVNSVTAAGGHEHQGASQGTNQESYTASHSAVAGQHEHTVPTRSGSCTPLYIGVKFLQYLP